MINIASIIAIAVLLIIIIVIVDMIKHILKVATGIILIIVIVALAVNAVAYFEVKSLNKDFNESVNLFMLKDNNTMLAAFELNANTATPLDYRTVTEEASDRYLRIITIDILAFNTTKLKGIYIAGREMQKEEALEMLRSENAPAYFPDSTNTKSAVFATLVAESSKENPKFLIKAILQKNADIYPEVLSFKILKKIPYSYILARTLP